MCGLTNKAIILSSFFWLGGVRGVFAVDGEISILCLLCLHVCTVRTKRSKFSKLYCTFSVFLPFKKQVGAFSQKSDYNYVMASVFSTKQADLLLWKCYIKFTSQIVMNSVNFNWELKEVRHINLPVRISPLHRTSPHFRSILSFCWGGVPASVR